ncbi:MAG TPA: flagellar assembly protein FliW [Spirochaetota bacterium]|nr:flagellar assembly protein FliW [Spirochaetota bacterium]
MGIKIQTKPFGEIEVSELQVIDFPDGILGFDFIRKFVVLDAEDEGSPFKWMQAFDEKDLAFIIIRPADFMQNYELIISQSDYEAVNAKSADELLVFAIVTIPENPENMTANLQGPIIINPSKRLGRQAISMTEKYTVRHKILEEIKRKSEAGG